MTTSAPTADAPDADNQAAPAGKAHKHTNRLIAATSPYLLQHAHNPVDWIPWGPEALAKARAEDKPIFLSIGYSACHWCHVMERESFENEAVAARMNEHFVNVKVDREERPDLDELYMAFVQAFTGHGGWPMSTFLTPDGRPFFGGTYWPPAPWRGMPGFVQILEHVHRLWAEKRDQVTATAGRVGDWLKENAAVEAAESPADAAVLDNAVDLLSRGFDSRNGGFGGAPKFPHAMELSLMLRRHRPGGGDSFRDMVELSLQKMARGGIYDHLGGGFARYSVDAHWTVPHFEKMLYDNALLTRAYLEAHQLTGDRFYADVAGETFDWVLREMQSPAGGIYSTIDADSEGEEGKFYVWDPAGLRETLGEELGEVAAKYYAVGPDGNFEHGKSTLTTPLTVAQVAKLLGRPADETLRMVEEARRKLLAAREKRVHPGVDTKILASWNGLMIASLARGAQVLDEPRYKDAADRAADYVLTGMTRDGRLLRTAKDGTAHITAFAEDYAAMIEALVDLYEAGFETRRLDQAVGLARTLIKHYGDPAGGGFFFTADDAEELIVRGKNSLDNATPSGNSTAAAALLRLSALTGDKDLAAAAEGTLRAFAKQMAERPFASANMLSALDARLSGLKEVALVGRRDDPEMIKALRLVRTTYLPNKVVALKEPGDDSADARVPLLAGKTAEGGRPTFYVCRDYACSRPVHTADELAALLV
jgi:uncharacterized protein YyaL (SSP411 family)